MLCWGSQWWMLDRVANYIHISHDAIVCIKIHRALEADQLRGWWSK